MRIPLVRASLFLTILATACRPDTTTHNAPIAYNPQQALGTYGGRFGKGILLLTINYINGDIVSGYASDRGMRRNVNGSVLSNGECLDFELKESGDDPLDGSFSFKFDTTRREITGNWNVLRGDDVSPKSFSLQRQWTNELPSVLSGRSWDQGSDSSVTFEQNFQCTYELYEHPEDTKSQLNTVQGNYILMGDTLLIDWQKNPYTPAQEMQLRVIKQALNETDPPDSIIVLMGNGWNLSQSRAG